MSMRLKVIPKFTGKEYKNIEEILNDRKAKELLWAEILFNSNSYTYWERYFYNLEVILEYRKASIFYTKFKNLFEKRKPLPEIKEKIEEREIRKFEEIYNSLG